MYQRYRCSPTDNVREPFRGTDMASMPLPTALAPSYAREKSTMRLGNHSSGSTSTFTMTFHLALRVAPATSSERRSGM
jgi:hypothetical protein